MKEKIRENDYTDDLSDLLKDMLDSFFSIEKTEENLINNINLFNKSWKKFFRKICDGFSENFSGFDNSDLVSIVNNSTNFTEKFYNPEFIGKFNLNDDEDLISFSVRCKTELNEKSGKKIQYELAKKILRATQVENICGAIFIFFDNNFNFRFSLIYDKPIGTSVKWSNFRRYTYFVSKDQTNRTFIDQLSNASFSSLDSLIEAFSVEKVTKEFYQEIADWYFWAIKNSEFPSDCENVLNGRNIAILRLITRLIFIWFMKEKRLIPESLFDEEELKEILIEFSCENNLEKNNYYRAILQNLFFAILNTPINERIFYPINAAIESDKIRKSLKYHSEFKNIDKIKEIFHTIPFLNGGLFECLDMDKKHPENDMGRYVYIDGFTEYPSNQAKVPNFLFFAEELKVDLSKDFEDNKYVNTKVRGIIKILKSYNFTIEENSLTDQEVALDPELLGKVFENLLASYNPETSTTARKATGSYYTPREIVDYMVSESIKEYFKIHYKNNFGLADYSVFEDNLEKLFSNTYEENPFDDKITDFLITKINEIKILDPAVGSGAFPMGALHKLVFLLSKLDPANKKWMQQQISVVEKITDPLIKDQIIKQIYENFERNELDYGRKLYIIQNCLYGVDIQQIAIQIAKLRFFISLLVDEIANKEEPNYGLEPLPNLETKLICANTLISLEEDDSSLFNSEIYENLENQLFAIRNRYFSTSDIKMKDLLKAEDGKIRRKIESTYLEESLKNTPEEIKEKLLKIAKWDPYKVNSSCDWFDPEWMFGVKDGFDIIIGNPPYIQLQKAFNYKIKYADIYKDQKYKTFDRMGDIYCLFYERGINLLKTNGVLAYITSNKWMRAGYGKNLREFFINYNPKILIDLGPDVFENATVDTNILIIQKISNENKTLAVTINKKEKDNINFSEELKNKGVELKNLNKDAWFIGNDAEQRLKEKIESIGKPLKDWDVKIYRGILTGLNEAFIIDSKKREEILANCKTEDERKRTEAIIKPILRGRDIKRYYYEWAGLWVIFIPWHFPLHKDLSIQGASEKAEKEFQKQYPSVYSHLLEFKEELSKRNKEETGIRYEWYALQRCAATYYPEFEKEKVVYSEIVRQPQFFYDTEKFYVEATSFLMTGENVKYICGLLNSKPVTCFFRQWYAGGGLGEEGYRYKKAFLENLPLPPITPTNQPMVNQIEKLVDEILEAKSKDKNADTSQWEKEIDEFVYKLYGLTDEEIRIVEGRR